MRPPAEDDVLVVLEELGEQRREMGREALADMPRHDPEADYILATAIQAETSLHGLELRAERDGHASVRLWPERFADFRLEVKHGWMMDAGDASIQDAFEYRQTGSAPQAVSRVHAVGLLRLFASTMEKGGAE